MFVKSLILRKGGRGGGVSGRFRCLDTTERDRSLGEGGRAQDVKSRGVWGACRHSPVALGTAPTPVLIGFPAVYPRTPPTAKVTLCSVSLWGGGALVLDVWPSWGYQLVLKPCSEARITTET